MSAELRNEQALRVPSTMQIGDIEFFADSFDADSVAAAYNEHGCVVVRGLMASYIPEIACDIDRVARESLALVEFAETVPEGWTTPNGALFISAPEGFRRDKQLMCLPLNYRNSAAFFRSALDERTLSIVTAVLGPNVELFTDGQCLYKEAMGGHPKHLHQDAAYFDHKYEGPMAQLTYVVNTTLKNGALHVVPGSHRMELLKHIDTFSHLGLDPDEWSWEQALPIPGQAGDSVFFHVKTIHGSQQNRSDQPRPAFIHRYRRADDYVVVSATTTSSHAAAERLKGEARKANQKGYLVGGFREHDSRLGSD